MSSVNTYQEFAKFYDRYVSGFSADLQLYLHFCDNSDRILEVGCGTGRVLKSLAEAGCKVLGVDISDAMLDIAKDKLQKYISTGHMRLKNFDFSKACLPEIFDRVLVTFYTFNYLLDDGVAEIFLSNIRKSLAKDGILLIDAFYPQPLQNPESAGVWHEKEIQADGLPVRLRDKRTMAGNVEERIQAYITADSAQTIVSRRRYYSKEELFIMLNKCGFKDIEFSDGYNINEFHRLQEKETVISSFVVKAICTS